MGTAPEKLKTKTEGEAEQPRYMHIVRQLEAAIAEGDYEIGERLPGEHELCQKFDVSRFTVRHAIRHLRDSGMVEARQGIGTVVLANRPSSTYAHAVDTLGDILQYAREPISNLTVSRSLPPVPTWPAASLAEGDRNG